MYDGREREVRVQLDVERARAVAGRLLTVYRDQGIFGKQEMPEDAVARPMERGSEEHRRFITLTVAIDYMRDADALWLSARRTYEDPDTRYLFVPRAVAGADPAKVGEDMRRYGLSRKVNNDPRTWRTICTTLTTSFGGRVDALIEAAGHDAVRLLALIRGRNAKGFPFLQGKKIGPLWVRMLHDNCGVELRRLNEVPLPIDVHTAQATLQLGCVSPDPGVSSGAMASLRDAAESVWREALLDSPGGEYALQLDAPLWLLSRNGCRQTVTWPCQYASECPVVQWCEPAQRWLRVAGSPNSDTSGWSVGARAI